MKKKRGNPVGKALKIIGIIFFAASVVVGAVYGSYADAFAAALAVWLVGLAIGMGLYGLGEVIRILHEISGKMDEKDTEEESRP
jgi:F0F1-type ATP synthase assembly protein I